MLTRIVTLSDCHDKRIILVGSSEAELDAAASRLEAELKPVWKEQGWYLHFDEKQAALTFNLANGFNPKAAAQAALQVALQEKAAYQRRVNAEVRRSGISPWPFLL